MPPTFSSLSRTIAFAAMLVGVTAAQNENAEAAPPVATGFVDKTLRVGEKDHRYVVYVPKDYQPAQGWPLLMFLHGMGECGTDGKRHVGVGLGPAIRRDPERWPFVVVFPQKPDRGSQWSEHGAMVMAMLAATEKEYSIDGKRRFLTGLSQGGCGTWELGAKHADVWAAIAPVCGYTFGKPADLAPNLKAMPIWAFHGEDDHTVPLKASLALVAAVESARGDALLTTYPNTAHNSWDKAYGEESLPRWLLAEAADRTGVWYLSDPDRAESFKVKVQADKDVAGRRATVTTLFELDRAGSWRVQHIHGDTAVLGPSPVAREGMLDRAEARAFFAARLKELRDARGSTSRYLDVDRGKLEPARDDAAGGIEVHGGAGPWTGMQSTGGSFAAFVTAMSELR